MIEGEQVISAYRLLLGRDPENEAVLNHLCSLPDLAALGQMLMTSEEFRRRASVGDFPQGREQWVCAEIRYGLRLWLDLMDLGVGAGALRDDWEPAETTFILSHLEAGEGFIDVGANIGWFTVLAAEKVGPGGHVYAFEPRRDLFRRLRDSVAANGMLERCTLFNMALGEAKSEMSIASVPDEFNPGHSFLVRDGAVAEGRVIDTVAVERLDTVSIDHKIALMKIDVEGAEAMVLSGAMGLIQRDRPFLITEFFPEWLRKVSGVEPEAYLGMLRDHGYRLFELTEAGVGAAVPDLPEGVAKPGFFLNLVATPDQRPFRVQIPGQSVAQVSTVDAVIDASLEGVCRQIYQLSDEMKHHGRDHARSLQQMQENHTAVWQQAQQEHSATTEVLLKTLQQMEENHTAVWQQAQQEHSATTEVLLKTLQQIEDLTLRSEQMARRLGQIAGQPGGHEGVASLVGLSRQIEAVDKRLGDVDTQVRKLRRPLLVRLLRKIGKLFSRAFWMRKREKVSAWYRARKDKGEDRGNQATSAVETRAVDVGTWAEVQSRRATTPVLNGADRPVVMLIDDRWPEPDRDSGSLDAVNMVSSLVECGYHVIFGVCTTRPQDPRYIEELRALGAHPLEDSGAAPLQSFIEAYGTDVDLFILSRVGAGGQFLELIRYNAPDAKIVFNTVDLHYIREARAARLAGDAEALAASELTRNREELLVGRSDMTYVVSSVEEEILQASVPGCATMVLPLSRNIRHAAKGFDERRGVGFIGGFEHAPNIDAIRYFLDEIWPRVRRLDPDIPFEIVGSRLPDDVLQGVVGNVTYLGPLPEVESWFDSLRMTVAPLRIGAGAKGKVASSLCNGLPTILSAIAAEGMSLKPGRDVLVGQGPADFASQIVRLHNDPVLWAELSANGLTFAESNLSVRHFKARVRESLIKIDLPAMALK